MVIGSIPQARYLFQHAGPDAGDLELAEDLPVLGRARLLEQKRSPAW